MLSFHRITLRTVCLALTLLLALTVPTVSTWADGGAAADAPPQSSSQGGEEDDGGTGLEPIEIEPESRAPEATPSAVTFTGSWLDRLLVALGFDRLRAAG